MVTVDNLYFAFASRALTYHCRSCGQCCRGYGIGEDISTLPDAHTHALLPFVDIETHRPTPNASGGLLAMFTFADGCRFHGDDNLCDIHRAHGAEAKPRICRLFPFAQIVDIDGLWTVMPQPRCPWRASTKSDDNADRLISDHLGLRREMGGDFLQGMQPECWEAKTVLGPEERRTIETRVRDGIMGVSIDAAFNLHREITLKNGFEPMRLSDEDIWLDLLRCAGKPAPLRPPSAALFVASIPFVRSHWCRSFTQEELPLALSALHLYLGALGEFGSRDLSGADLLHMVDYALPLVRVLVCAGGPIGPLPKEPPHSDWQEHWPMLQERAAQGDLLGETLLEILRPIEQGALILLRALGLSLLQ